MTSIKGSRRGVGRGAWRLGALALTLVVLGEFTTLSADDRAPWWSASEPATLPAITSGRSMSDTPEVRYEALTRPARFKSIQTKTELSYEDRLVTCTDTQNCYRTVCEDQGCWQQRCCWSIFGWHTVCCWSPKIVEVQVPITTNVARQRVERTPHESIAQFRTTVSELVVVQSRRPYAKKSFSTIEAELLNRKLNRDRMAYRTSRFDDSGSMTTSPLGD